MGGNSNVIMLLLLLLLLLLVLVLDFRAGGGGWSVRSLVGIFLFFCSDEYGWRRRGVDVKEVVFRMLW